MPAVSTRSIVCISVADILWLQSSFCIPLCSLEVALFIQHGMTEIYFVASLQAVIADPLPVGARNGVAWVHSIHGEAETKQNSPLYAK